MEYLYAPLTLKILRGAEDGWIGVFNWKYIDFLSHQYCTKSGVTAQCSAELYI